jgi:hypothetical protein
VRGRRLVEEGILVFDIFWAWVLVDREVLVTGWVGREVAVA